MCVCVSYQDMNTLPKLALGWAGPFIGCVFLGGGGNIWVDDDTHEDAWVLG